MISRRFKVFSKRKAWRATVEHESYDNGGRQTKECVFAVLLKPTRDAARTIRTRLDVGFGFHVDSPR